MSEYHATLTLYYEEEIEGEAYFRRLAERLPDPAHAAKMRLMAEVEAFAAAAVRPLLTAHGLIPRATDALAASGRAQAEEKDCDWQTLIADMRRTFPGYIKDFERLEAMAPLPDRAALQVLTAHEHAAIAFLEAEAAGSPDPAAPLRRYLRMGRA